MKLFCIVVLLALFASCQSTPTGPTRAVGQRGVISQGDVLASKGPIKLPMNFDVETSKTDELNMLVEFQSLSLSRSQTDPNSKARALEIKQNQLQSARIYLETTLGALKRFDIFGIHSSGAVMALNSELEDVGDIEFSEPTQRNKIDLFLAATLLLSGERRELYDGSDELTYSVTIKFSITDRKKSFVGRPIEQTGVAKRKFLKDIVTGGYLGGYSPTEEGRAIKEAVMDAMKKAMPAFGNEFPVTASVKGVASSDINKMAIDRGVNHGLTNDNQMVLWYKDGGVVPVALAYARAEAGKDSSSITVYKWDKSVAAKFVQKQLATNPAWASSNPLYATSMGLSYPQDWNKQEP